MGKPSRETLSSHECSQIIVEIVRCTVSYGARGAVHSVRSETDRPLSRRLDRCDRVIQNESRDPFGGNVYYVTMQITFLTRKFRNGEHNLHCDVVHIKTKWVSSLTLDCNGVFAIKAYYYSDSRAKRTAGYLHVNNVICIVTYTSPLKIRAHGR